MSKINVVKDLSILVDFVVSIIAASIKVSHPDLSDTLFMLSGVVLFIAVVCVIWEWIKKK